MCISKEDRATVEKILNDTFVEGVRYTLREYHYKTAREWLCSSPPRKVVDKPSEVLDSISFYTDISGMYYYAATDTEPCTEEEALELTSLHNSNDNGLVWWRDLTDAEKCPQALVFGKNYIEQLDCRELYGLI